MKKNFKSSMKSFKRTFNKFSRRGKRFTAKHQYGIFFSALTFVTIMVGINEYMVRSNEKMVSQIHAIKPGAFPMSNAIPLPKQEERKPALIKKMR